MAERKKIVIQTGEATDEPLPTPHFDAEATLTARPVMPLNDQEAHQMPYGDYAGRAQKPFWRRPALLVAIVLAAIGVGVAAGFAIGIYRNRSTAQPPVTTAPAPTMEDTEPSQTVEPTPEERIATISEQREEEPAVEPEEEAEPKEEERERTTTRNERRDNDDEASQPVVAKPPVARDKKPIKVDEYTIEDERAERQAERERRREERRAERRERRRRQGDEEISVPRGIERAGREVDRIREIFEGRQP
jgi:hypothetical protein